MKERSLQLSRTLRLVLSFLLFTIMGVTKLQAHDFEVDNLLYSIISTDPPEVSVDGHIDGTSASDELLIPEIVEWGTVTYTVTAISDNAFADCTDMFGDIDIPNSVVTIGSHAFDGAGFDGNLIIGNSVITIGDYAFANLGSTGGDLTIPNSVNYIGDYAFYQSYFDGAFSLSTAIVSIGEYAFYNCNHVTISALKLENTLNYLGDYAFYHCSNMTGRLTLSTALTSIGAHAFEGCGFTQLNFGSTTGSQLQTIGDYAFAYCENMTGNLAFPTSLQAVGQYAFCDCGFNNTLTLRNVQTIGAYAFEYCHFSKNLTIPTTVTELGQGAFYNAFTAGTLTINANINTIPDNAFSGCQFTGALTIPNTVTSIGAGAFSYCSGFIGGLNIHEDVSSIGYGAFNECSGFTALNYNATNCVINGSEWDDYGWVNYCTNLTVLNIGEGVQSISAHAFEVNFSAINVLAPTPPTLGESVFANVTTTPVYVPCDYEEAYTSINWGGFTNLAGLCAGTVTVLTNPTDAGVVTGGGYYEAGAYCTVSATANSGYAFANWTKNGKLASTNAEYTFVVAGDMTLVANFVPEGNITFADANVKSICVEHWDSNGDGELSYAEAASVADLSDYFQNNSGITSFEELQYFIGLSSIGSWAFGDCENLTSIVLPSLLTTIGGAAFAYCGNLASIELPASLTVIGESVFYGCSSLTGSITIGEQVTMIGDNAFAYCSNITTLNFNAINCVITNEYGQHGWLYGCTGLHTLTLGEQVQTIPDYAFHRSDVNLTGELVIPASVTSIGEQAFANNSFTAIYSLPMTPPALGDNAFENLSQNTPVYVPCDAVEAYENVSWGGYDAINGLCGGTVIVSVNPAGAGTVTGGGVYEANQSCTVSATANTGYVFVNWTKSGMIVSNNPEYTFLVANDITLVANFVPEGNIIFADANVKSICVEHWDANGDGELSYVEASAVTSLSNEWGDSYFQNNAEITSFDELQYFIGLSTIDSRAFRNCDNLVSVVFPNSLISIGERAFYNCNNLVSVVFPNSLTSIGYRAFRLCGLESIVLPASLLSISEEAFYSAIAEVYCLAMTPPLLGDNAFNGVNQSIPVYVPCDAVEAYENVSWGGFNAINGLCGGEVTVASNPTEAGVVTGGGTIGPNQYCTVSATANTGYVFVNWTKNGMIVSNNPEYTFLVANDMTLVASFVPEGNITFADANVKSICVEHWDTNGDGELSYVEAAAVTSLDDCFRENTEITSFDEFQYFVGLTSIGAYAFYNCSGLVSVELPNAVRSIGMRAFSGCSSISGNLLIPSSVTTIEYEAFSNCTSFTGELTIPASVTSIGYGVFMNTGFTTLNYNAVNSAVNVNTGMVGYHWLSLCNALTTLNIGEGVQVIPGAAFSSGSYGNNAFTGSLIIPGSVTSIGANAFYNNQFSSLYVMAEMPPVLGDNAFYNMNQNIEVVYVPCASQEAYSSVSWGDFNNYLGMCDGEVVVTIDPDGGGCVTGGGNYTGGSTCTLMATANSGCVFLHWIRDNVVVSSNNEYSFVVYGDVTLTARFLSVPAGNIAFADDNVKNICVEQWDANGDGELSYAEAANVTDLGNYFNVNANITTFDELQYFVGLSAIGEQAFYNCSNLTSVILPNTLTTIGAWAFGYCSSLNCDLTLGEFVTNIGDYAFYYCQNLHSIISLAVTPPSITNTSFEGCYYGVPLYIPCGTAEAYQNASYWSSFSNIHAGLYDWIEQDGLRYEITDATNRYVMLTGFAQGVTSADNLVIPSVVHDDCSGVDYTVTAIANNAFSGCSGLTGDLLLPNTLITIGDFAFMDCTGLNGELTIPENVTRIGMRGFVNCRFTIIHYNAINCSNMGWDDNHELVYYVFWKNYDLQEIIIGENVTQIPDYAFGARNSQNCHLTFLGNSVSSIGEYAFYHDEESDDLGLVGELNLPSSITYIGSYAFAGCLGLTGDLVIPENITLIGGAAFINCSFSSLHYNATDCESIGIIQGTYYFAFWNNRNLEQIVIGDNVTQIPIYAFGNLNAKHCHVDLGNGVTRINNYAFYYSGNDSEYSISGFIVIPSSVNYLGYGAFYGCSGLTEIWCKPSIAPTVYSNTFYNVDKSIPVHVSCNAMNSYQAATYWAEFSDITESPHVLNVMSNDEQLGMASVTMYGTCENNQSEVHAQAYDGCMFVNWTDQVGVVVSNDADYSFELVKDMVLTANFVQMENYCIFVGGGSTDNWSNVYNWKPQALPTESDGVVIRSDAVVDTDVVIASLVVNDNNHIIINGSASMAIAGDVITPEDSSIVIKEGGQLVHSVDGVKATVQRRIAPYTEGLKDGWYLISSPLSNNVAVTAVQNLLSNNYDLYYYDEPTHYWINQEKTGNSFSLIEKGKGYLYGNVGDAVYGFEESYDGWTTIDADGDGYKWFAESGISHSGSYCIKSASYINNIGALTPDNYLVSPHVEFTSNSTISFWAAAQDENWAAEHFGVAVSTSGNDNPSDFTTIQEWTMTAKSDKGVGSWYQFTVDLSSYAGQNGYVAIRHFDCTDFYYLLVDDITVTGLTHTISVSFAGELQNGTAMVNVPLSYTEGIDLSGFNLVGNPFAHYVSSYDIVNVADGCFRMNETCDNLMVSQVSSTDPLKPAEGFFVKTTNEGASITFNTTKRGNIEDGEGSIWLNVQENGKTIDRLIVKEANAQPLEKFSLNNGSTKIFADQDQQELAIVPCEGNEQAVNFKASHNGEYTIYVSVENMELEYLHLIDNKTGQDVDLLLTPSYSFDARTIDYASRFKLVFATGLANMGDDFGFFDANGNLAIYGIEGTATLQVIDVTGRIISSETFSGNYSKAINAKAGVYMLRLIQGENTRTQKIVVK